MKIFSPHNGKTVALFERVREYDGLRLGSGVFSGQASLQSSEGCTGGAAGLAGLYEKQRKKRRINSIAV